MSTGRGRVRVVAPSYPTRLINIRPVSVSISVMRVPAYFFHICEYPRVPAGIYKNILKNKYLTLIIVWINKSPFSD